MEDESKLAGAFVRRKIQWLTGDKKKDPDRATLARLRRGIGKAPGSMPELWEATLSGLPEALLSTDGEPTKGEWAVHTALTLYALHQQGRDAHSECMDREGEGLGKAVSALVDKQNRDKDLPRVKRRFDAAATSDSPAEFSHHLRSLIQLMKAERIPLDYARLTEDLYWFQISERRDKIRLRWGQDFYRELMGKDVQENAPGKETESQEQGKEG